MSFFVTCAAFTANGTCCKNEAKKGIVLCSTHNRIYQDGGQIKVQQWAYQEYANKKNFKQTNTAVYKKDTEKVVRSRKRVREFFESGQEELKLEPMTKQERHRIYLRFAANRKYTLKSSGASNKKIITIRKKK